MYIYINSVVSEKRPSTDDEDNDNHSVSTVYGLCVNSKENQLLGSGERERERREKNWRTKKERVTGDSGKGGWEMGKKKYPDSIFPHSPQRVCVCGFGVVMPMERSARSLPVPYWFFTPK